MKRITGKYNTAIIYTDVVDDNALQQIEYMCNLAFLKNSKIRLMPDVHAGNGCTIGTTMTITDAIVPNFVGVDIGCGMEVVKIKQKEIDLKKLDQLINEKIPSGFNIRDCAHIYNEMINLEDLRCDHRKISLKRAKRSIGTLGGGNHFIEVDKDNEGYLYIVIHSGSRMLGKEVCNYYQEEAFNENNGFTKEVKQKIIETYKKEGRKKEIEKALLELKNNLPITNKPFAYCRNQLLEDYLFDMDIVQKFADINRKAMINEIVKGMNLDVLERFTTIHNYIDIENMILRKGAVSAKKNEKIIIPLNMRDGSIIALGKGNDDWNQSAPHGAGRLLSRAEAKKSITLTQFEESMKGVYSTSITESTIDESPFVYKAMEDIINNINDTVNIVSIIKPIYNFKAK